MVFVHCCTSNIRTAFQCNIAESCTSITQGQCRPIWSLHHNTYPSLSSDSPWFRNPAARTPVPSVTLGILAYVGKLLGVDMVDENDLPSLIACVDCCGGVCF